MSSQSAGLHLWWVICALNFLAYQTLGLNTDGFLLLSFKHSILSDPLRVLESWNHSHETPCSWKGIRCAETTTAALKDKIARVIGLILPNSQLQGSIPPYLGYIKYLQSLDLSNNSFNGSIPNSLFNATDLRFLDFSNNWISGEIPNSIEKLKNLQYLNLSGNALVGNVPANLTAMQNLTVVSLKNNYLTGTLPGRFEAVEVLDLSSNLINGPLPPDFDGCSLRYLNISYNGLSGEILPEFAEKIPANATIDISFNSLTGAISYSMVFLNQDSQSFSGNPYLCGLPSRNPCRVPSLPSATPNASSLTSPPAFAAIPETQDSQAETNTSNLEVLGTGSHPKKLTFLRPETIIGIIVGDLIGIGILALIFLYVYRSKRKKNVENALTQEAATANSDVSFLITDLRGFTRWACLRKRNENGENSETTSSTDDEVEEPIAQNSQENQRQQEPEQSKEGILVTVDGEKELELETLLKASAYILGATGSSIMYKAVLEDGTSLAVRRIGENNVERFKDFENQVRTIAKLVHPNLVRVRGFYWGPDEKLIIYDFVPNGSLANARHSKNRKMGTSPSGHLPWEVRLKIARGMARGLTYLHEKRHVHGNLKPSNVLLGSDMEPKIRDFGLERLIMGDMIYKTRGSARNFGSKRSTASHDSLHEFSLGPSPSPSPSSMSGVSAYHAPESLRSIKPNPKWDVYSFGMILLELLTGKAVTLDEMGQANGLLVEDKARALRMADVAIRAEMEGKEESLLACFKLGYSCVTPLPQKRPSMKEVLHVLDKIPSKCLRICSLAIDS